MDVAAFGEFHHPAGIYIGDYLPESRLLLNQGDAIFQVISEDIIGGSTAGACDFADINGDGKDDLLITGEFAVDDDPLPGEATVRDDFRIYTNNSR